MKIITCLIAIVFYCNCIIGQDGIGVLVLKEVNSLRDSLGLNKLEYDLVLVEAAKDQAYYIALSQNLSHFQTTFSKETVSERIIYYNGNRTYVGENVAFVSLDFDEELEIDNIKAAKKLFNSWLNSPPHYQNLIYPEFTKMGLGTKLDKSGKLYAAQVFSSNEIVLPKAFRKSELSWGIRPIEFTCKDELQRYETMFFANGLEIINNEVYFYFHDIDFFNKVIKNENDGLALDIIVREQLPCNKENQFHISEVYDGEMQRPIYRNDIIRNNISHNKNKIKFKIGVVPSYIQKYQWEANIIVIKDNKLCDYSIPIEIPSDIFPLLELRPYEDLNDCFNGDSIDDLSVEKKAISRKVVESFNIELWYAKRDKKYHFMNSVEFNRLLSWGEFIKEIDIDCFASVEGSTWFNLELMDERKNNISNLLVENSVDMKRVHISTDENWIMMNEQIENLDISLLKNKTKPQVKRYLKYHETPFLDSLLFEQRKTHVRAIIDTTIEINSFNDFSIAQYYDSTLTLDILPWNKILREDFIQKNEMISIDIIDSLIDVIELRTNLLGTASIKTTNYYMDSLLVEHLLIEVDHDDSKQIFNYSHFLTKYWFSKYTNWFNDREIANTITPQKLNDLVSEIDTNVINIKDVTRLKVNVLLSGIHYYVAHNNWGIVDVYFKQIKDLIQLDDFTTEEAIQLALFCNRFHKFDIAVDILNPFFEENILTEDGLFILAKTATLIRYNLAHEKYLSYMNKAKEINLKRYCHWLDQSFQIQRDEFLKNEFCVECNSF